ncbi:MAG: putative sugar nucleotidyl transferase [bacterium]|nr:putative sugar nucleotidyl transferase [bacterium]MCX7917544.1 putative sugar nucleotidyl transferase [bacterium]MDW8163737.1 putative sugar nucleotidyl transferase [Candidatus Omnitrophota bacterium]
MKILIYEDEKWIDLTPMSFIKAVFELRCGFNSLLKKIISILPEEDITLWVRDYLKDLIAIKYNFKVNEETFLEDDILIVNGRWLIDREIEIKLEEEKICVNNEEIVYGILKKETVNKYWNGNISEFLKNLIKELKKEETDYVIIRYPWNLVHYNSQIIKFDFKKNEKSGIYGKFSEKATIYGQEKEIFLASTAEVYPFVVIDTTHGPVYIDEGVKIFPFSVIIGPCYIGEKTQIMPGAKIREGNSFGPVCRIGGEVEESIFHSYSNKYHDGFIGHSYIGEFVNLGALTTNSDLKNDYSNVSVYLNGKPVDTGELKVGSFIGDHTKTSIGTLFNTGTIVGIMCNITADNILPKYFPSFVWYVNGKFMKGYGVDYALKTAKISMERRDRILLPEEEKVIRKVYEITEDERKAQIEKSRKISK